MPFETRFTLGLDHIIFTAVKVIPVPGIKHPVVLIWENNQSTWNSQSIDGNNSDVGIANQNFLLTVARHGMHQCLPSQEGDSLCYHGLSVEESTTCGRALLDYI